MLIACLVTIAVTLGGAALSYLYDKDAPLWVRLAGGVAVGTSLLGFLGYCATLVVGAGVGAVIVPTLLLLSPLWVFRYAGPRALLKRDIHRLRRRRWRSASRWWLALSFALGSMLLWWLFRGLIAVRPDGLYTNDHHNIGDLPWHCAIIQGFAVGQNYPPQHVEFAGTRLTYPFLVDFITAQYVMCGANLAQAFFLQNLTLGLALLVLLLRWAFQLTRSAAVAALAPFVLFFSGGWGWLYLRSDVGASGRTLADFLLHLPHDYTTGTNNYKWANSLTTLFLTQRGLLLAVPLALIVLTLLWQNWDKRDTSASPRLVWAGCIMGLLPLIHGHTFLSLCLVSGGLAILSFSPKTLVPWVQRWAGFFGPTALLVLPQARALAEKSGVRAGAFMGWNPGWEATALGESFVRFWLRNTGPLVPLLLTALLWGVFGLPRSPISSRLRRYYLPFLLCFLVPSLFRLAPWAWDNMKVFLYWFLPSVVIALSVVVWLGRNAGWAGKVAAVTLLFLLGAAGMVDVWRVASGQSAYQVFDNTGIEFAQKLREATPPDTIILHAPAFNHPALLSGRHLLAGYTGHLWSHGLAFESRVADVKRIYAGEPDAPMLLSRYRVGYVVIGPSEQSSADVHVNPIFWSRYPVAFEYAGYRVYRVGKP